MTAIDNQEKQKALRGARFLNPSKDLLGGELVRNPADYSSKNSFRNRIRELGGIVDGDMINDSIQYGEAVRASDGCNAFVLFRPGVTFSFIWAPYEGVHYAGEMVSVWPYVYDNQKAVESGYWSSKELLTMKEIAAKNSESNENSS